MKIVSLILARGGSKGIPRKNIIDVNGNPLISYTIKTSSESKSHETWVCTDDHEIAEVAKSFGANVIIRPKEISQDFSKSEESLLFFSSQIEFDYIVFIQPTSPLLTKEFIDMGIDLILSKKYDSCFSAYEEHWLPRWENGEDGAYPVDWDMHNRPMRQQVKVKWVENGAFYITSKEMLENSKIRFSGKIGIVEMPQSLSFQVDSYDDLKLISKLL